MNELSRRLRKLETNRPVAEPVELVDISGIDPAVLAMWVALDGDVGRMNLDQLDLFGTELRKLTV